MSRYFKTNRDSVSGLRIKEIIEHKKINEAKIEILKDKYGFTQHYILDNYLSGIDVVTFDNEPDMKVWKKCKEVENGYSPRLSSMEGKLIKKEFNSVEKIDSDVFNEIVGVTGFVQYTGFNFTIPNIYVLIIGDDWRCDIPSDFTEISNIEYRKLSKDEEE